MRWSGVDERDGHADWVLVDFPFLNSLGISPFSCQLMMWWERQDEHEMAQSLGLTAKGP